jgi:exosortase K
MVVKMQFEKITKQFSFYIPYYLLSLLALLCLKLFYSRAGADNLTWILTPTTGWVSILSGIPFTYAPGEGYVNHSLRFIIAPSCCGIRFLGITAAMLIFSFLHRTGCGSPGRSIRWILGSLGFSYLFTIFVNGLRILLSIYIPLGLSGAGIYIRRLTPERLHTLIGTAVYFSSLLILYRAVSLICLGKPAAFSRPPFVRSCLSPVFWYFFIVLGLPALNSSYAESRGRFSEYAALISAACLILLLLYGTIHLLIIFPQKIKRTFGFDGIIKSRYRKKRNH